MKHTASARKNSSARGMSTRSRNQVATGCRFAVCVQNDGYEASLERHNIYVILPDKDAESGRDLRVVDESGEDYLFSADRFLAIDGPAAVKASLLKASWQPPGTVPEGVRVSTAEAFRTVSEGCVPPNRTLDRTGLKCMYGRVVVTLAWVMS
jgi:hypothetical protein